MAVQFDFARSILLAGVASVSMVVAAPAAAQTPVHISLPAQSLSASLRQLALQTGDEILFAPAIVANRRAPPLKGDYRPLDAIRQLLAPHGLMVEETAPKVYVIKARGRVTTVSGQPVTGALTARAIPAALGAASAAPARQELTAAAQEGRGAITGIVRGPDGVGVPGAIVRVVGTSITTTTDSNGVYRLTGVPAGQQSVELEYLGDAPQRVDVTVTAGAEQVADLARATDKEVLVVYGYLGSIQRSLNQQKNASNSATVVSSDLMGQFPAETVSEALRRVPGVGFSRADDTGEGSRITVRGFTSEAIQVQLNGLALQGTNHERTIDLSGYLADNISEIRIEKSLLPSMEASGSGGLVKIETKSGLDYGDFSASLGFEGERNGDLRFGSEWQANGTIGFKLAPNFGIAASVAYRDTDRTNFDAAVTGLTPPVLPVGVAGTGSVPASMDFPYDDVFNRQLVTGVNYARRHRAEKNLLASINLAWELGDHTRLRLDLQRNDREARSVTSRTIMSLNTASFEMPIPELGGEVRRRSVLANFRPGLFLYDYDQNIQSNSVSFRGTTRSGGLTLDYKAGWSHAISKSNNYTITMQTAAQTNFAQFFNNLQYNEDDDATRTRRVVDGGFTLLPNGLPVPDLSAAGQAFVLNPANYTVTIGAPRSYSDNPTTAWTGEFNAKYEFGGFLDYLKAGVKYDRSDRRSADDVFPASVANLGAFQTFAPISGRPTSLSDLGSLYVSDTLAMVGAGSFAFPRMYDAPAYFARFAALTRDDPTTPFNEQRFTLNDYLGLDPILTSNALSRTKTREITWAGYLEGQLKFGKFDIVGGARYERVSRTGNALTTPTIILNQPGAVSEARETFINAGLVRFEDLGGTVDTITPSLLVNYRPNSNLVARFHYNMSTTNPDIRMIRRGAQVQIDLRTISNRWTIREANPDLKAQTVHNFEIGLSRYFDKPAGVIGVNGFLKKTNNNFTNVLISDVVEDSVRQRILDFFGPLVQSRPELFTYDSSTTFYLSQPRNGEGGTVWGVEAEAIKQLNFLPGFLKNFGVSGNVTYTTGDFPVIVQGRTDAGALANFTLNKPLAEASEWVYNASLFYAAGGFEGRLVYTRQEASVPSAGYNPNDLNTIIPAYSTMDMRLSYTAKVGGTKVTFFLEGDDLLRGSKDPDIRRGVGPAFNRKDADYFFPNTFQFNGGRAFTLGARAQF